MSDGTKREYGQMRYIADVLVERLRPACERIEIAGSLRRQEAMVGDIELIAIPRHYTDLFGEPTGQTEVDTLLASWPVRLLKNGQKFKQFEFPGKTGTLYKVDLFLQPDPATWGCNMLIRTGDREFTKWMVTPQWQGGAKPDHYRIEGARVWRDGVALETPEERDVFALWDMDWVEPEDRTAALRRVWQSPVRKAA